MKITTVLLLFLSLSFPVISIAQNADLQKRLKKVDKLVTKNKLEKATLKVEEMMELYPSFGGGWNVLVVLRKELWMRSEREDSKLGTIEITTEGENVDQAAIESVKKLEQLLNQMVPSKIKHAEYINAMRRALVYSNTTYDSSINLRSHYKKANVDTNVNELALEYYNDGEKAFHKKDYDKAIEKYTLALEHQPDFYKAILYIGDAYYFQEKYDEAITQFDEAIKMQPQLLEPRKYLVDSYAGKELYENCLIESIKTFTIYPDLSMYTKLEEAVRLNNSKLTVFWTPRDCLPNKINENEFIEIKEGKARGYWKYYKNAREEVAKFCDDSGIIILENALTKSKYLEVYSWEKMLQESPSSQFEDARKMQELGYLDCYVLITCFHPDFYAQYRDFADNNQEKIIKYFNAIIESETKIKKL